MIALDHILYGFQVTVGASFLSQTLVLQDSTTVKFEIWDTAGQERYLFELDLLATNVIAYVNNYIPMFHMYDNYLVVCSDAFVYVWMCVNACTSHMRGKERGNGQKTRFYNPEYITHSLHNFYHGFIHSIFNNTEASTDYQGA